ncbi:hypothetical protein GW17_00032471 [Ensete ventricosum]|nr:hypothetical protein GW17_00032471 [Ensete ventricosum]
MGVPVSGRPCRRQLMPTGGLPTGVVLASIAPVGGCLYSLAAGCSHLRQPLLQASRRLAMAWLRAGRGQLLLRAGRGQSLLRVA